MNLSLTLSLLLACVAAAPTVRATVPAAIEATAIQVDDSVGMADEQQRFLRERSLQDLEDLERIRIGVQTETVTVTVDQTAVNGAFAFGEKFVVITPPQAGASTTVKCTATLSQSGANLQIYLRKAFRPDKDGNGEAKQADCEAANDNDFVAPDTETCSVTNFRNSGDIVVGYVAVLDQALNQGATYVISFICEATRPDNSGVGGCFSDENTVDVLGKGETEMKDLSVGDKVFSGQGYESVYAFAHLDKTTSAEYLQIYTNDQKAPLSVTGDHLVLVAGKYVPAREVKAGDFLSGIHGENKKTVKTIKTTEKTGLYAPLTPSGTIVVGGVKTSTYVALQGKSGSAGHGHAIIGGMSTPLTYHFVNHMALSPIRMACLGISSSLCEVDRIRDDNGYATFVSFWFDLIQWAEAKPLMAQVFLVLLFLCIIVPLFVVESIVGAALAPSLVLSAAATIYASSLHKKHQSLAFKAKTL